MAAAPVPAANSAPAAPAQAMPTYASASLYVGDLNPEVTEGMLFESFNQIGPVASIRVCRDTVTRRSLGYAYVNFHSVVDAERALETLNNEPIKGRPCRIMWSQRDPTVRKSGSGNIFIKNLDKSIDLKALQETFSVFGAILSCKVVTDETGESKGYGFVHFANEESAKEAIDKVDGMIIGGQKVYVAKFMPRKERIAKFGDPLANVTNVYVKNLPDSVQTDKDLQEFFKDVGEITSVFLSVDDGKKSKGFGFVNFASPELAKKAIDAKNGFSHGDPPKQLYVGRAQKKSEREEDLRQKVEQLKLERLNKWQGVNLYVKNLDDTINDERLREEFKAFGTITSAKVMVDDKSNVSRGFGFVCFSTPEEATRAVTEMNGRMIAGKPVYVALAQRKEIRRAQLEQQHARRVKSLPVGNAMGGPGMYPQPMFYAAQPGMNQQQGFMYQQPPMMPRGRGAGWMPQAQPGYAAVPNAQGGYMMPMQGRQAGGQPGARRGRDANRRGGAASRGGVNQRGVIGPMDPMQQGVPQQVPFPTIQAIAAQPLDAKTISSLPPEQQKLVVGEKLYPLIAASNQRLAGKITGMLLDSYYTDEIIHLIESPEALSAKIQEALQVLEEHNQGATAPAGAQ